MADDPQAKILESRTSGFESRLSVFSDLLRSRENYKPGRTGNNQNVSWTSLYEWKGQKYNISLEPKKHA